MLLPNSVHFSSARDNWETPQDFFEKLNNEFRFTLDVCAEEHSAKCKRYFTKKDNALNKEWNGICWMNPPYGRGIGVWLHKERIRLHGIDTPESRTRDLEEKKYGLIAKEMVTHFLPVGSIQTLVTVRDKVGKFGRILGKFTIYDAVTDSTMMLNDWMVREHYAVAYNGQSKEDIAEQHLINRRLLVDKNNR